MAHSLSIFCVFFTLCRQKRRIEIVLYTLVLIIKKDVQVYTKMSGYFLTYKRLAWNNNKFNSFSQNAGKLKKSGCTIMYTFGKISMTEVKKRTFSLKEMCIFGTFLSIVRQVPYYCKKSAENTHFFKRKSAIYDVFLENKQVNLNFLQEWTPCWNTMLYLKVELY